MIIWSLITVLIIADMFTRIRFTAKFGAALILIFMPHLIIVRKWLDILGLGVCKLPFTVLTAYTFLRLGLMPIKKHKTMSHRLNALCGGRRLLNLGTYATLIQIPLYIAYSAFGGFTKTGHLILPDAVFAYFFITLMLFNGMLRVIFTSRWLNVFKRLICFFLIPVPLFNIGIMFYLKHIAGKEFDYFVYKLDDMPKEIENRICETKYPILLVHGVGFRDARFFNYWGRIPKYLRTRGAQIFYGHQEGWATVEYNASLLHDRVMEVLKETGAEKINIIAHSKGGLDCRCMINTYDMGKYIASLTTMGTPHHGVKFADVLLAKLPPNLVGFISKRIDSIFDAYGDTNPDFNTAVRELTEEYAAKFNAATPDSPQVYYQSYASVMSSVFSDNILSIPYIISRAVGCKQNDGLVPEPSAHWGEYKGVIKNKRMSGVSHGDLIDLKREDFRGFDMLSKYAEIVKELKEKGF